MANLKKVSLVVLVAVLAVVGYKFTMKSGTDQTAATAGATPLTDTTTTPPASTAVTPPAPASANTKKISAEETYRDPSGEEKVTFMLTIDSTGVITEAASTVLAENPIAIRRQTAFRDGFSAAVVGKKLSDLANIDVVSGSSLTTTAFNSALASLKAQI